MSESKYCLWEDGYDRICNLLEEDDEYPVAGYKEVLNRVYQMVRESAGNRVLELGFGTGILTKKLYQDGYEIFGVDHSESMVEAGQEQMPNAHLYCDDYELGVPETLLFQEFDVCVATYSINKMDAYEKADLIREVLSKLKPGGKFIIGDIAFDSLKTMKEFAKTIKKKRIRFDYPLIREEAQKDFGDIQWIPISKCAAIMVVEK